MTPPFFYYQGFICVSCFFRSKTHLLEMSSSNSKLIHPLPLFWGTLFLGILLDQLSKFWALESLRPIHTQIVLEGFWNWTYVENTGVAFGFLQGHNNLLAVVIILILVLSYWVARDFDWRRKEVNLIGAFILSGAIGNGIDRFRHGFVIDFVDWHYKGWHWPAFNIADSLICLSVSWILLRQIFPPKSSLLISPSEKESFESR